MENMLEEETSAFEEGNVGSGTLMTDRCQDAVDKGLISIKTQLKNSIWTKKEIVTSFKRHIFDYIGEANKRCYENRKTRKLIF